MNIHINNSYNIWSIKKIKSIINEHINNPKNIGRTYPGLIVEWWLHNLGYYITVPFTSISFINKINNRFKHVDLESHNG